MQLGEKLNLEQAKGERGKKEKVLLSMKCKLYFL